MKEIWKDVFGYEGIYQVSNLGNIKSLNRMTMTINGNKYFTKGREIKTRKTKDNVVQVNLSKDGIKRTYTIARLAYKAFHPEFDINDNDLIILHKDEKQENNKLENLYALDKHDIETKPPINLDRQYQHKAVICITTDKRFVSIADGEKYYGIKKYNGSISRCCQGKIKYAGKIVLDDGTEYKLVWKYLKEQL